MLKFGGLGHTLEIGFISIISGNKTSLLLYLQTHVELTRGNIHFCINIFDGDIIKITQFAP